MLHSNPHCSPRPAGTTTLSHLQKYAGLGAPAPRGEGTGSSHTVGRPHTPALPAVTTSMVCSLPEPLTGWSSSSLPLSLNLQQESIKKEKMTQIKLQIKPEALLLLEHPFALLLTPSNTGLGRYGPLPLTLSPQAGGLQHPQLPPPEAEGTAGHCLGSGS